MNLMIVLIVLIVMILILSLSYTKTTVQSNGILKHVLFFTNVLTQEQYHRVLDECHLLQPYLKENHGERVKRKTIQIEPHSYVSTLFYGNPFLDYLHTRLGFRVTPSSILPIEFRMYEKGGMMDWHRDVVHSLVRNCPQIEIVFTLENNSDSKTLWIEETKNGVTQEVTHEVVTQNNSILITQGNGAYHKVTPVSTGYRSIIKIAYDIV
jgi:hypothetical protein